MTPGGFGGRGALPISNSAALGGLGISIGLVGADLNMSLERFNLKSDPVASGAAEDSSCIMNGAGAAGFGVAGVGPVVAPGTVNLDGCQALGSGIADGMDGAVTGAPAVTGGLAAGMGAGMDETAGAALEEMSNIFAGAAVMGV